MSAFLAFLHSQLLIKLPYPTTSCTGKTIIVTGANTGLGKEAARHFVRLGAAKVVLGCRSIEKAEAAKHDIVSSSAERKDDVVEVWPLDLESYDSVKAFARRAQSQLPRIDAVVENAGKATQKFAIVGGFESTITVNVVSTMLLALLLLPKLKAVGKEFGITPTLTIVSSEVHAFAKFPESTAPNILTALNQQDEKTWQERYPLSKLLEVFAVRQLASEKSAADLGVTINMVNPGFCESELSREMGFGFKVMKFFLARTTEAGSRTLVHAGLQGKETHGEFLSDCTGRCHSYRGDMITD